jgi:hypothetical protein
MILLMLALCTCMLCDSALGQGMGAVGGGHGRGGGARNAPDRHTDSSKYYTGSQPPPAQTALTQHGGQYLANDANVFEIVYMPLQTRIYLYDKNYKPLNASNLRAQMLLQPSDDNPIGPISFQYAALPPGMSAQDYVVAALDLEQLPDGEIPITFTFTGLPDKKHTAASFTPVFTRSRIRPYVAQVLTTDADRGPIAQQRVCPVDGLTLSGKGAVVKLLIGDWPLYVCSKDCIPAVRQAPEKFLGNSPSSASRN